MGDLLSKSVRGVAWSAIERFSVQGIQFVLTLIIARLVSPSDYGLIAMLGIFFAISQSFVDSGFSNALIQKKDRTEVDFSTVFYFNIVISIVVYGILYASAPAIGRFYNEPQLVTVCRWQGLILILNSFMLVQQTRLIIASDFRMLAKASLLSVLLSGIAGVWFAWLGYGVWALVIQALGRAVLNVVLLWWFVAWKPQIVFSRQSFRQLFSFGSKLLVGGLLHTLYMNLYTLVIGRFFNAAEVGYFNRSQSLATFPSINLMGIVNRAMYPVLCERQDDEQRLLETFYHYLRGTVFFVFPLMIGLSVLSKPLIVFVLTERWLPAAPYLSILCIAYMWHPIMNFNWQLLNVKGRSDLSLRSEIIKKVGAFAILFLSLPLGMKAICWGLLFYSLFDMATIYFFVRRIYCFDIRKEIALLFPILFCSLLMGGCVYAVCYIFSCPIWQVLVGIPVGIVSYGAACFLFHLKEIELIKQYIRK